MAKGGQVAPPSYYIKGGGVLPPPREFTQLDLSLLSSPFSLSLSLVWFPWFGACTQGLETWDIGEVSTIRTSSCCWTPGPDLFSSAALLDRSPGDVVHTVCVRVLRGAARVALIIAGAPTRP